MISEGCHINFINLLYAGGRSGAGNLQVVGPPPLQWSAPRPCKLRHPIMYVYFACAIMFIPPIILFLFADIFTLLRHAVYETMRLSCGSCGPFHAVDVPVSAKNSFSKAVSGQCEEERLQIVFCFLRTNRCIINYVMNFFICMQREK